MFKYTIKYFSEYDEREITTSGLIGASSYGKAAKQLINYYGEDNVYQIQLEELENPIALSDILVAFEQDKKE